MRPVSLCHEHPQMGRMRGPVHPSGPSQRQGRWERGKMWGRPSRSCKLDPERGFSKPGFLPHLPAPEAVLKWPLR